MTETESIAVLERGHSTAIEVAGVDLVFRTIRLETKTPTGGKIAKASGFTDDQHPHVLQWREDGDLEDIRTHEEADLEEGTKFIVAEAGATNRITLDGNEYDWPARFINEPTLRKLGRVGDDKVIYFEKLDQPDQMLTGDDIIDLDELGVEDFKTRNGTPTKQQHVHVKHIGELETVKIKVSETNTLQQIWDRAYAELEVAQDPRDLFQADLRGGSTSLMDHLGLTLVEAQRRGLCDKKFEIAARTGGA